MHGLRPWPSRAKLYKDLQGLFYRFASVRSSYLLPTAVESHLAGGALCGGPL